MMAPVRTLCKLRNTSSFCFAQAVALLAIRIGSLLPTLLYETIAILFQISYRPMTKAKTQATAWALVLALVRRYGMILEAA